MHMPLNDEIDTYYAVPAKAGVSAEEEKIKRAVVRLNGNILGFVIGTIAALGIFVATNWLVLKGGPVVGPHLGLLGQFFIGYTVTFLGSLVGALYAFVIGFVSGKLIGWIYNRVAFIGTANKI